MKLRLILLATTLAVLGACAYTPPPPPHVITDFIPAGARVEYFAQIHDGSWKRTMTMDSLPSPMHVRVAEKWALSAAQQRLGGQWKDYRFRVIPSEGCPVVVWQRAYRFIP
jgi:hypothetical protein